MLLASGIHGNKPAMETVVQQLLLYLQVFQGAAEQAKKAQESVENAAPSLSAPSINLPKFNPPSISPTIFSDSGDIDPRAVALPGLHAAMAEKVSAAPL